MSKKPFNVKTQEDLSPHQIRRLRRWQIEQAEYAEQRAFKKALEEEGYEDNEKEL